MEGNGGSPMEGWPSINLVPTIEDGAWSDVDPEKLIHLTTPFTVGGLPNGMESGKPSVAMRFDLPDGRTVIVETSMALFLSAADGLKAAHGDPRT